MAELKLPASEEQVRALKVGDFVELTGRMITGRDAAHKWLVEQHRDGRTLYCVPRYDALDETIEYLTEECCQGSCAV